MAEKRPRQSDDDCSPEPCKEGHGRRADTPAQVPAKGWMDVLWRMKTQMVEDNLNIVAAGVAFYAFVAVVPGLAATIAIYALFLDPNQLQAHLSMLSDVVPGEVMPILREQITRIVEDSQAAGISAVLGVAIALYGSAKATKALITGLNVAYDEHESRGFFRLNAIAIGLTLAGMVGVLVVFTIVTVLPSILRNIGLSEGFEWLLSLGRWPVLILLFMTALAVLYRVGPCREAPKWRWISPGAIGAAILWVLGSAAFSFYVSQFGNYQKTYGSLGAIVVFLLWLLLSAYAILLGAELNTEIERQTVRDTTTGEPEPRGGRGAYAADTVGPARGETKPDPASRERDDERSRGQPQGGPRRR